MFVQPKAIQNMETSLQRQNTIGALQRQNTIAGRQPTSIKYKSPIKLQTPEDKDEDYDNDSFISERSEKSLKKKKTKKKK